MKIALIVFFLGIQIGRLSNAASLYAAPSFVDISPGNQNGSTTLTWSAQEAPVGIVFGLSVNGGGEGFTSVYGSAGSVQVSYITAGSEYKYNMYALPHNAGQAPLATVTVNGRLASGNLSAVPMVVEIPSGSSVGETTLSWNTVGATGIVFGISVNGAPQTFSSIYPADGSTPVTYITSGNTFLFNMYRVPYSPGDLPIATSEVVGVAGATQAGCDFVFTPAAPLVTDLASLGSNKTICLQSGDYHVTQTIDIGQNQTVKGATGNRQDVRIFSSAKRIVGFNGNYSVLSGVSLIGRGGPAFGSAESTEYGVLSYWRSGVSVENVSITHTMIGIGVVGSSQVSVSNCLIKETGDLPPIGGAQPSIWVADSTGVSVSGCEITGEMDPTRVADNDGGSAFYGSSDITFVNNSVFRTGIVYFVNVDGAVVSSNRAIVGTEWALDIVQGTRNVEFSNNYIEGMGWGAGVISSTSNLTFSNNTYVDNNLYGYAYCSGINIGYDNCVNTNANVVFLGDRSYKDGVQQSSASCAAYGWNPRLNCKKLGVRGQ